MRLRQTWPAAHLRRGHAFGTCIDGEPIHRWGDATIYSLHASKLTHCGEGGRTCRGRRESARRMRVDAELRHRRRKYGRAVRQQRQTQGSRLPRFGLAYCPVLWPNIRDAGRCATATVRKLASIPGVTIYELPGGVTQSEQLSGRGCLCGDSKLSAVRLSATLRSTCCANTVSRAPLLPSALFRFP